MSESQTNDLLAERASGTHEARLARGYLAGQGAQVVGLIAGLAVTTVLARRLTLSAFGTYALLLSLSTYLFILQGIVETAAIKAFAEATDREARNRAFSIVVVVYGAAGIVASMAIVGLGWALLGLWSIPADLHHDARIAVVGLAGAMFLSWPARVFYDALRGNQFFGQAAAADATAAVTTGALVIALVMMRVDLWLIVVAAGSRSVFLGLASAIFVRRTPLIHSCFVPRRIAGREIAAFLRSSGWFLVASCADFVIFSLDRTILAAFRSPRTVGLYEGPVRAHYLVRDLQAAVSAPVLPAAARYLAERDAGRLHDLLLRGMRYMLAIVVPVALVLIVLARPLLEAWLGRRYSDAAPALMILVGYWLVYANTGVGWQMLIAAGQIRKFAIYAAAASAVNAALSLSLTPFLGLNGVVLGTAIPFVLALPVFLRLVPGQFRVSVAELAREVWLPAYSTAVAVGSGLTALRLTVDLATIPACVGASAAAVAVYWAIYYAVWLRPTERRLVRTLIRQLAPRI